MTVIDRRGVGEIKDSGARPDTRAELPNPEKPLSLMDGRLLFFDRMFSSGPQEGPGSQRGYQVHTTDGLRIIASIDWTDAWGPLMHVSMSYRDRDPRWKEIAFVKRAFFGNRDAAMILPQAEDYVNVQEHTFHLWETPQVWGIR